MFTDKISLKSEALHVSEELGLCPKPQKAIVTLVQTELMRSFITTPGVRRGEAQILTNPRPLHH
jgi:hypothetical protein